MRNHLIATSLTLLATACTGGPEEYKEPPVLKITSPQRSLVKGDTAPIMVTGTVTPNSTGDAVEKVLVNGVQATLGADGSFQALVQIQPGATLLETEARDANGGIAKDARAVHAGELRNAGSNISRAVAASISADSFSKISGMATNMVNATDFKAMLAPMQPMIHADDEDGEDCKFVRGWINDLTFGNFEVSLTPVAGGLAFSAEVTDIYVPGRARYAFACANGETNFSVGATRIGVSGTLVVTPKGGMQGFATKLENQNVTIEGLDIQADGFPGWVIDAMDLDQKIQGIIAWGAERALEPAMNAALGGLAGPKTIDVMGKQMTMEISPSDIAFDPASGMVGLDMKMMIAGAENAKYIFTDNGTPTLDPGNGFQIAIADDFANEMMSEAHAIGLMNFPFPAHGGTFDNAQISMSLPPMISADPADGNMRVMLGDMMVTFTQLGTPVGKAALNAKIDLKIVEASNGYAVAIQLGEPQLTVNVVDDIANATTFADSDLQKIMEACLKAQIEGISKLLVSVPLPTVGGLQMRNFSVGGDNGYVMINGSLE